MKIMSVPLITDLHVKIQSELSKSSLSTGCKIIDSFFENALTCNQLIQFSGEAGSGKSQLLIQIALVNLLQNKFEKKILFLTVRKQLSLDRLFQIARKLNRSRI